jgi:thioredoxin-related protein
MKVLKIITLLAFLLSMVMCSSEQRKKQNIKMIKNAKYIIPDSLYAFFPKNDSDCKLGIYITNAVENDLPYFFEEFSINYIII